GRQPRHDEGFRCRRGRSGGLRPPRPPRGCVRAHRECLLRRRDLDARHPDLAHRRSRTADRGTCRSDTRQARRRRAALRQHGASPRAPRRQSVRSGGADAQEGPGPTGGRVVKSLTVVAPVYNEEAVIDAFYAELKGVLGALEPRYFSRILFVVDRSQDSTLSIIRRIAAGDPAVQVLSLSSRFGHQMSLLAGIDHADADAIIMLDSDLQHPPSLIPQLIAEFENGFEIVHTLRQDSDDIGWITRSTARLFYRLINLVSDVEIIENAADFRLISRRVADVFRTRIRERNQFLRGLCGWVGFRSAAIPFRVRPRAAGVTKYSIRR